MRQLFTYWPPRIVSAKWTFQLSRSSTLASAAAMPPSAITVCALPSSDLQTRPTETPAGGGFDRRAQSCAAGADDEHVVFVSLVVGHQRILQSVHTPIEQSRTYRSLKPTEKRLHQAHSMCLRLRQLTQLYARSPMGALRKLIDAAADDVTHRMTAEQVAAQENAVSRQNERADADAE